MYKYILGFILINIFVAAFPNTDIKNNINQSQEDDYVQEHDSPFLHNELKTTLTSERPISNYEVTEIVVDIPDNRTVGPIITNYTIPRPLNTVPIVTETENVINNGETERVTISTDHEKEGKKNYVSIFHVKAEFEDKTEQTTQVVDNHHVSHVSGFKNYLHTIKQGIIDGVKSIIGRHKVNYDDSDGPLGFINKLHKKSTVAAHQFHDVVFGHSSHETN
ncbi:uncharacterized protein LOC116777523 isoform X1 [Danaus plexippus]|uniref:uncharacterized protein LOC116777523 isoform X1 n=1 Tax=Danaus plexippus TaxID=13037 RepID=UPI002AAF6587|nr:uncharacterized protein LOC116777523 isoform X1 [Danaus plexippus]